MELCKKALEENIIVYLGTGCGKTHIAVLLIYELGHLIRKPQKSVCVFLAPTVALVHQVSLCALWILSNLILNFRLCSISDRMLYFMCLMYLYSPRLGCISGCS